MSTKSLSLGIFLGSFVFLLSAKSFAADNKVDSSTVSASSVTTHSIAGAAAAPGGVPLLQAFSFIFDQDPVDSEYNTVTTSDLDAPTLPSNDLKEIVPKVFFKSIVDGPYKLSRNHINLATKNRNDAKIFDNMRGDWTFLPDGLTVKNLNPLHLAVIIGNRSVVRDLLAFGVDADAEMDLGGVPQWRSLTPLHLASMQNQLDIAQDLMTLGKAKIDKGSKSGATPLAYSGSKEMANFLLQSRAQVTNEFRVGGIFEKKKTPTLVDLVFNGRSLDVFKCVVEVGKANVGVPLRIRVGDFDCGSILQVAASQKGSEDIVKYLAARPEVPVDDLESARKIVEKMNKELANFLSQEQMRKNCDSEIASEPVLTLEPIDE